jgi:hypothetical protein
MKTTILAFGVIQAIVANETTVDNFGDILNHFFQC